MSLLAQTPVLDPIVLPEHIEPPTARRWPLLAAVVPLLGGIVMWLVTGSPLSLVFALLGPLIMVGNAIDAARVRRKYQRTTAKREARAWQRAERELERAHAIERERMLRHTGDVVAASAAALTSLAPANAEFALVLGRGETPSTVSLSRPPQTAAARDFAARARTVDEAPVTVPLGTGLHIFGARIVTEAVVCGLVTQVLMRAGAVGLRGDVADELGIAAHGMFTIVITRDAHVRAGSDEVLWFVTTPSVSTPFGIGAVLDVSNPNAAQLTTATAVSTLQVEALALAQFAALRPTVSAGPTQPPMSVLAAELTSTRTPGTLRAAIGATGSATIALDLVADGPHAVVTGVTGTGKSELLCTWIAAMAREYTPAEVNFVLVDFKGGMAFEPLRCLPHTAAIITDLDLAEVARGVHSLRAEMRRRSALLARTGARDIGECPELARLVIVVDEFAALLHEHAALSAVFTDIAARGRALGMHLVLGTQRATATVRDALLANCPLRVSLRAADAAESRYVLGSDAAFQLPGGSHGRGLAEVLRASDTGSQTVRIALTSPHVLETIASSHHRPEAAVLSPWLPSLPCTLELADVRARARSGGIVLGLSDNPEAQQQNAVVLEPSTRGLCIAGGVGSGKSTALAAILQQAPQAIVVPRDAEAAWRLLCGGEIAASAVVLCDDVDARLANYSAEQAAKWVAAWEQHIRRAAEADGLVALSIGRLSGMIAKIAELLGERTLLGTASRSEHMALGGTSETWRAEKIPGRACMRGLETQLVHVDTTLLRERERTEPMLAWQPTGPLYGLVAAPSRRLLQGLANDAPGHHVTSLADVSSTAPQQLLVGSAEDWMRNSALWQTVRNTGSLLVPAGAPQLLRTLGGYADVPPYSRATAGRAWEVGPFQAVPRVVNIAALERVSAAPH